MKILHSRPGFALFTSLACAGSLFAQTTAPSDSERTDRNVINLAAFVVSDQMVDQYRAVDAVSATRVRAAIIDSPGSISVITPELLQDINPTRLYEATRYFAGVSEGRANSFNDRHMLRGFENSGRTVDSFSSIQQNNADFLWAERVEILKGPNAILAPTGTPGGSINVVSKVPLYTKKNEVSAVLGLSDAQRVNLDITGPFSPGSPWAYRVLASYQDGKLNLQDGRIRRKMLGAQLSYRMSPRTTIVVRGGYDYRNLYVPFPVYVDSSVVNGGDARLAEGFSWHDRRDGQEEWAHRGGPYAFGDLLITTSFGEHISMRVATKYQYNLQDDQFAFGVVPSLRNRYNPSTGQLTPDQTWSLNPATGEHTPTDSPYFDPTQIRRRAQWPRRWTQHYAAQLDLAANYTFGGVTSSTGLGTSFERSTEDTFIKQGNPDLPLFNLFDQVYGAIPDWTILARDLGTESRELSTYLNERLGFWQDRIFVTAGAVHIAAESSTLNRLNNSTSSLDDDKTVFIYGVVLKPWRNVALYASRSSNAVPGIANNRPLWREGKQREIGFKVETTDNRLMLTAAYFEISQTNVTVPNPAFLNDPTEPPSLISDISNDGFEVELVGALTKNLSVVASYTYLDQKDSLGRPVRAISPRNAGLLLKYRFPGTWEKLSVFGGVSHVGRRSGEAPAIDFTSLGVVAQPSFFHPPLTLVSLGGKYDWSERLSIAMNLDNVTNERYLIPTARANNTMGEPFNARATITYRF